MFSSNICVSILSNSAASSLCFGAMWLVENTFGLWLTMILTPHFDRSQTIIGAVGSKLVVRFLISMQEDKGFDCYTSTTSVSFYRRAKKTDFQCVSHRTLWQPRYTTQICAKSGRFDEKTITLFLYQDFQFTSRVCYNIWKSLLSIPERYYNNYNRLNNDKNILHNDIFFYCHVECSKIEYTIVTTFLVLMNWIRNKLVSWSFINRNIWNEMKSLAVLFSSKMFQKSRNSSLNR